MEAKVLDNPKVLSVIAHDFATTTQDLSKVHALILAHEHFVKSETLLEAFILEFALLKESDQISQFRVVGFLKKWIDLNRLKFLDTSIGIGKRLDTFVNSPSLSEGLKKTLTSAITNEATKTGLGDDCEDDEDNVVIPPVIMKKKNKNSASKLFCYDPLEIARQLTLIDHLHITEVQLTEFLNTRWLNPNGSPYLNNNSVRANVVAHWFGYELILCKAKHRLKLLTRILRILMSLMQLQNYQSLMSIYLGLNLQPVYNLVLSLLEQLPSKTKDIWDEVHFLLSYNNNYSNYRDAVKKKHLPLIPCQEIYLKDLLYHDESHPNVVNGLIEFRKLETMGNIIDYFRKCQLAKYKLQEEPELYDYLYTIKNDITLETLEKLVTECSLDYSSTSTGHSDTDIELRISGALRLPRASLGGTPEKSRPSFSAIRKSLSMSEGDKELKSASTTSVSNSSASSTNSILLIDKMAKVQTYEK